MIDKKRLLREGWHLTRPPRLEGKVKNAMMNPVRKQKKPKEQMRPKRREEDKTHTTEEKGSGHYF
ncbi:MAG: hypothetical protein PHV93_03190 [Candidatus Pacebacteria bacterium]|nr:hypothetical protein [Candidatus Paceibacterota bacterium]